MFTEKQTRHFYSHLVQNGECLEWGLNKDPPGYGRLCLGDGTGGCKNYKAHRIAWELENGPIPDGLCVLHKCDNPSCANPDHLFLGTRRDNAADRDKKGRQANGARQGASKLTESQVRLVKFQHKNVPAARLIKMLGLPCTAGNIYDIRRNNTWKHVRRQA